MGNGLVKFKYFKYLDGYFGNFIIDVLQSKVIELERELRRKDVEIQEREYYLKELREQLSKQIVVIVEFTEEFQNKCIQLNKFQDVLYMQGGSSFQVFLDKVFFEVYRKILGLVFFYSRRGVKVGVFVELIIRIYDFNKFFEFFFEKVRVRKDFR